MSDFYLDLRAVGSRQTDLAADRLKFFPDIAIHRVEERDFSAVIAGDEDAEIWAPFRTEKVMVLLAGRIALEPKDWELARRVEGKGGLACKAIFKKFVDGGWSTLETLNGNFTAIVYDGRDEAQRRIYIVTDRAGYAPAFRANDVQKRPVFSSNTDLLAAAIGVWDDLDVTSLGEFVATGRLSFPFTYYSQLKALEFGGITKLELGAEGVANVNTRKYYEFKYTGPDGNGNLEEMASGLAEAFKESVRRRTLPEMGKSMVSLSGGLDSRTVLSAAPRGTTSFSFLDEENYETRIADRIAAALGSENFKLKRHPEYYTDVAAMGLRLNAGMGRFIVNTYLGFRDELRAAGMRNLLTGCYCDYFFKALLVNRRTNRWLRTDQFAPYKDDWYVPFFKFDSPEMPAVTERVEEIVPERLRNKWDNASVLEAEARRVMPLFYEPDSRGVAQRVISWSAVTADNDVLDMFRRIPHRMKLNTKVFLEMVRKVCPPEVLRIPDANTGVALTATEFERFFGRWRRALAFLAQQKFARNIRTTGSWPDWGYYMAHSKKLHELWFKENALARDVFQRFLGYDAFDRQPGWWVERGQMEVIMRLITLKIWMDVRIRASGDVAVALADN